MDREDVDKLFRLLEQYYPNAKQVRNPDTKLAWALALERYPYDGIRAAAIRYGAENKYFPDIADLTSRCEVRDEAIAQNRVVSPSMARDIREIERLAPALMEMGRLMELDYPSRGIPHPNDARRQGWSVEVWNARVRAEFPEMSAGKAGGCGDG